MPVGVHLSLKSDSIRSKEPASISHSTENDSKPVGTVLNLSPKTDWIATLSSSESNPPLSLESQKMKNHLPSDIRHRFLNENGSNSLQFPDQRFLQIPQEGDNNTKPTDLNDHLNSAPRSIRTSENDTSAQPSTYISAARYSLAPNINGHQEPTVYADLECTRSDLDFRIDSVYAWHAIMGSHNSDKLTEEILSKLEDDVAIINAIYKANPALCRERVARSHVTLFTRMISVQKREITEMREENFRSGSRKFTLSKESPEYDWVVRHFVERMGIVTSNDDFLVTQVDRYKLPYLEWKFENKRAALVESRKSEVITWVYHGTPTAEAFESIMKIGLKVGGVEYINDAQNNLVLLPVRHGSSFGPGIYASSSPKAPIRFCESVGKVILAQALCGEVHHYNYGIPKGVGVESVICYDILSTGKEEDVFVFRTGDQLLPTYVIHFTRVKRPL